MSYQVRVTDVAARRTAVVAATTTWQEFPALWKELLDEVWACLRAGGVYGGCRNVMLYRDDVPHVEVGVELRQPCPLTGRVVASALPAGQTAMTIHRGPFTALASAHRDVLDWCAEQGRRPVGPRWEVYGPHHDDPRRAQDRDLLPAVVTGHGAGRHEFALPRRTTGQGWLLREAAGRTVEFRSWGRDQSKSSGRISFRSRLRGEGPAERSAGGRL
jgi:effector-binding domain-containing protein